MGAESTELLEAIERFKGRLSARVAIIASSIETDPLGNIVSTPENIARVGELIARMKDEFVDDELLEAVNAYIESLDDVLRGVLESFAEFDGVDPDVLGAIAQQYKGEVGSWLLNPSTYQRALWLPLTNGIILATAQGVPIENTMEALVQTTNEAPVSEEVKGTVESTPILLERTQVAAAAEQTGSQFFYFQGRPIKSTRKWCRDREGKYWHIEEVKQWGRDAANGKEWEGMVEGTNEQTIFIHLGGWFGDRNSCRHILVPVPRSRVPEEDLARMREKGLIE